MARSRQRTARDTLLEQLLSPEPPPTSFSRKNPQSHIYVQYSRKIGRRCYCYGHLQNHLWALIESDPQVKTYNERVAAVPMAGSGGTVVSVRPSAVAISNTGEVHCHFTLGSDPSAQGDGPDRRSVIEAWARQNGFVAKFWSAKDFAAMGVRLNNLKQLLKFVSLRGLVVTPTVSHDIVEMLKHHRKTTVGGVMSALPEHDPDLVLRELSQLILSQTCYSDIDRHALSRATELSINDETRSPD